MRTITPEGAVSDGTYKNGQLHGLVRWVMNDGGGCFALFNEEDMQARVGFDIDFQETYRFGPQVYLLKELSPKDFV